MQAVNFQLMFLISNTFDDFNTVMMVSCSYSFGELNGYAYIFITNYNKIVRNV